MAGRTAHHLTENAQRCMANPPVSNAERWILRGGRPARRAWRVQHPADEGVLLTDRCCGLRRVALCLLVGSVGLLATGCTGTGQVRVVPLLRTDFTEREPLVQEIKIDEAYYWLEGEELNVALRYDRNSPLGPAFYFDWQMSLVLDALPAGSSRLYQLQGDAVRIVQTAGADQRRSRTWTGIAVAGAPEHGRLSGRFHINVRQQQFTLLGGWQPPFLRAPTLIVVGRFEAVENAERGRAIRAETEAPGFERTGSPASRPAPPG